MSEPDRESEVDTEAQVLFDSSVFRVALDQVAVTKAKLQLAAQALHPQNTHLQANHVVSGLRRLSEMREFVKCVREEMSLLALKKAINEPGVHVSKTDVWDALGIPKKLQVPDISDIHKEISTDTIKHCTRKAVAQVIELPKMESVRLALDTPFTEWDFESDHPLITDVYKTAQLPPEAIIAAVKKKENELQKYIKGGLFIRTAEEMYEEWAADCKSETDKLRFFGFKTGDKALGFTSVYEASQQHKLEFMKYGPGTHKEYSLSYTDEVTRLTAQIKENPDSVDMFDTVAMRLNKESGGENPILAILAMLEFAIMRLEDDNRREEMVFYVMNLLNIEFCPDIRYPEKKQDYTVKALENSRSLQFFLKLEAADFGMSTSMIDEKNPKEVKKADTRSKRSGMHTISSGPGTEEVQWEARLSPVWRLMSIKYPKFIKNLYKELEQRTAKYGYLDHPRMQNLRERIQKLKLTI